MNKTITILLATYNGEKYISRQLDSLFNQTNTDWHLVIRDDGSKDNTPAIIQRYKERYPGKIDILETGGQNTGSLFNFAALFAAAADADYIMFCDQDDEWEKYKIELTFSKMKELEKEYGSDHPILIYTNFQYVDESTAIIESKKNFDINRISNFGFSQLLAQNPVYGCTSLMNRSLVKKIGSIPVQAYFHDYWIAMIASAFGKLFYLQEKTVLYRQHASNVSGNFDNDSFKKRFQRIVVNRKNMAETKARYKMLLCFKTKYGNELNRMHRRVLDDFLCFIRKKNLVCLVKSIRNKIRSQTLAQTMLMYATALFTKAPSQS